MFESIEKILKRRVLTERRFRVINHWFLALFLNINKKYSAAAEQYNMISEHLSNDPMWRYQSIKCRYKAKEYIEVNKSCNEFLSSTYDKDFNLLTKRITVFIYWYAGISAAITENYENAISNLNTYLSLHKSQKVKADVFEWMGFSHLKLNQYKLAYKYYSEAIKRDPLNESSLVNLKKLKKILD